MGHPDFRAAGKIFASLGPDEAWGMVKLAPELQDEVVEGAPGIFEPFNGAWGAGGATRVVLEKANKKLVALAMEMAWVGVTTAGKKGKS